MYVQHIALRVHEGRQAAFEAALVDVRRDVFTAPGFRGLAVVQGVEDALTYVVEVRWETLDELTEFARSGRFEQAWAPVEPFLALAPEGDVFVERPGLAFTGPGAPADLEGLLTRRSG